jgi:hypothetical protein
MYPQTIEFVDSAHAYAQFVTRDPVSGAESGDPADARYRAALFATSDGGRTWAALRHPRPLGSNPQLYAVDARTLLLNVEPYGWYVSSDGGRSYRHDPPDPTGQFLPPEYELTRRDPSRAFRLDCADACVVARLDKGGTATTAPHQPTMPASTSGLAEGADGRVWVAGLDGAGRPHVQVSADRGGTWRSVTPAAQGAHGGGADGAFDWLELQASPDRTDVWLIGYPRVSAGGGASALGAALKVVGMPLVWRVAGDGLVAKGVLARPTPGPDVPFYTVAPIGGGLLAVSGPGCFCLVDDGWLRSPTPQPIEHLRVLTDGTVVGNAITNQTVYLGTRAGRNVSWVEVELT